MSTTAAAGPEGQATQTEAPADVTIAPGEVVTRVEDLPNQLRQEIVAAREAGTTLSELKKLFGPQVAPDVIREVLPPATKREAKARSTKATAQADAEAKQDRPEVEAARQESTTDKVEFDNVKQAGDVIRRIEGKDEPQAESEPKQPKYVDAAVARELAEGITRARLKGIGRAKLAQLAGTIPMTPYRIEVLNRALPEEVAPIREAIRKVDTGEVELPTRGGTKTGTKTGGSAAHKLNEVAKLLHANWGDIKPDVRDQLAALVGAPKEEMK